MRLKRFCAAVSSAWRCATTASAVAFSSARWATKDSAVNFAFCARRTLSLGLGQLCLEDLSIHARDHFAEFDEVTFVNVDFSDTTRQFGSYIHFSGFICPLAANSLPIVLGLNITQARAATTMQARIMLTRGSAFFPPFISYPKPHKKEL